MGINNNFLLIIGFIFLTILSINSIIFAEPISSKSEDYRAEAVCRKWASYYIPSSELHFGISKSYQASTNTYKVWGAINAIGYGWLQFGCRTGIKGQSSGDSIGELQLCDQEDNNECNIWSPYVWNVYYEGVVDLVAQKVITDKGNFFGDSKNDIDKKIEKWGFSYPDTTINTNKKEITDNNLITSPNNKSKDSLKSKNGTNYEGNTTGNFCSWTDEKGVVHVETGTKCKLQ